MSRSQNASHYGRLVEEFAADRYAIRLDHRRVKGVHLDGVAADGSPVDIKGAMSNRKSGPGRFRLWRDQHRVLEAQDGCYIFVRYAARQDGISVQQTRAVDAQAVRVDWGGSGNHRRDSAQAKVLARSVF
jgi:hypothetical protein